ncbi:YpbF family protein [Caldibacillus lycopersici]|uniref:YpbF family protein n=1 Tax=Perspicuibacillus lycopersici TaxID=1325689 RepID=A0AAE3LNB2_9BACI|nr:YpbF family protein [Perspicuibacillus lycopersici]MCU9613736.1 YpbF family protein [Perspicuibacillus lycopersici]
MDEVIKNLENWTDTATKEMLQGVVKKKQKFDNYKQLHLLVMWSTVSVTFCYLLFLYQNVFSVYSYSFAEMFSAFLNMEANAYLLVFTIGLFGLMNVLKKKVDKYEGEYHALRCEIIDKSKDLWKSPEAWANRHQVFEVMKVTYDINLYHENK